jgi:murein DD-endopeptidase MepM/ murein hydrolase activator NlpD
MVAVTVDVTVPPDRVPSGISHRIDYGFSPGNSFASLVNGRSITGPELALDAREPIVLASPLRGEGRFASDACCAADSAHRSFRVVVDGSRFYKTETFAYDWLRIQDGRLFEGDGSRVEQRFGYGADVIAAAEGTAVAVRDDMPEEVPGQPPVNVKTPRDYSGNHVVVQIQPNVWATYAHLKPGSITVSVGDRVTTGQLLGLLGNTGNSPLAPHLHFELSDGPDIATSSSLPFVFDRYTLAGTVNPEDLWTVIEHRDNPVLPIAGTPQEQDETYALGMTIQDFP